LIRRVCVFCGSCHGNKPSYTHAAEMLADELAKHAIDLVYGGGNVGLMGVVADRMLAHDRHVLGVIPEALQRLEVAHEGLSELRVVHSMHERKACMADHADAFIALPGGLGTMEELFEILTWRQLGIHAKPIGLLNVDGYFDPLRTWLANGVDEGFLRPEHAGLLIIAETPQVLVQAIRAEVPAPGRAKWIDRDER